MQRRYRNRRFVHGLQIGLMAGRRLFLAETVPIIGKAARIDALHQVDIAVIAEALLGDAHALHVGGQHWREVDVDQNTIGPFGGDHPADDGRAVRRGTAEVFHARSVIHHYLAQCDGADAGQAAFHRRRNGAAVRHILGQIAAAVDAGQDQIGLVILQYRAQRQHHAIGGRAAHGKAARADLAQPHGLAQRQAVAGTRLLFGRRNHPHIVRQFGSNRFQRDQAGGVDAIIIGDENAHGFRAPADRCRPCKASTRRG